MQQHTPSHFRHSAPASFTPLMASVFQKNNPLTQLCNMLNQPATPMDYNQDLPSVLVVFISHADFQLLLATGPKCFFLSKNEAMCLLKESALGEKIFRCARIGLDALNQVEKVVFVCETLLESIDPKDYIGRYGYLFGYIEDLLVTQKQTCT